MIYSGRWARVGRCWTMVTTTMIMPKTRTVLASDQTHIHRQNHAYVKVCVLDIASIAFTWL